MQNEFKLAVSQLSAESVQVIAQRSPGWPVVGTPNVPYMQYMSAPRGELQTSAAFWQGGSVLQQTSPGCPQASHWDFAPIAMHALPLLQDPLQHDCPVEPHCEVESEPVLPLDVPPQLASADNKAPRMVAESRCLGGMRLESTV